MPSRAEVHIAVVESVGVGGYKIAVVVAGTLVAWAEAARRGTVEEALHSHDFPGMVLEQGQRQPYAPSASLR